MEDHLQYGNQGYFPRPYEDMDLLAMDCDCAQRWGADTKPNPIRDQSEAFAIRIVNLYSYIQDEKKEFVMSKQLLRCGTSIGANVTEAHYAQSDADFLSKMYIAYKEAGECAFWLRLLHNTKYLSIVEYNSITSDINNILALITSIIRSTKTKIEQKKSKK